MNSRTEYKKTENPSVLKRAYKQQVANTTGICHLCPYHSGENAFRKKRDKRNWKRRRKTQWNS